MHDHSVVLRSILIAAFVALVLSACADREVAATTASTIPASSISTTTTTIPATTTTTVASSTSTTSSTTTTTLAPLQGLALEVVHSGLRRPNLVLAPPGDDRLFIVLASGIVELSMPDGTLADDPFLDIRDLVNDIGIEQGLLGMAFHPGYGTNGRFFVYFSDDTNDTRLMEYRTSADPKRADPATGKTLLEFPRTGDRHHGGMLQFGNDGYLYLSVGDSGAASVNGQDPGTLLGTILRLDVDGGDPYAIPADNPFDGSDGRPEVWAYGLRNPWRFWIDVEENLIYIGDVGQNDREEIDVAPIAAPGLNYGWPVVEGTRCFRRANCDQSEFVAPAYEYGHDQGCSVTGGIVYRGAAIPELAGQYFLADWCGRWVRSFRWDGSAVADLTEWDELSGGQVNSFGYDGQGEVYLTTWEGDVSRITARR